MLNRRILRIKVFKSLYAAVQTWETASAASLADAQAAFKQSVEATRDLYLFMLGIVEPLTALAAQRLQSARQKAHPTEEDLHPNTKFADNQLARYFSEDEHFVKLFNKKKFSWQQYDLVLKKVLNSVVTKEWYKAYMASPARSMKEDCALFTHIFEEEFTELSELDDLLEDMNIWWNDDLAYALTWCCRSFSEIASGKEWTLPPLYQSELMKRGSASVEDDSAFASKLLEYAYCSYSDYSDRVAKLAEGWEKDRMVLTDVCLIVCALSECVHFPNIPLRVSMNEYVEISKYYGSLKSNVFVNGLLDKLIRQMQASGEITKQ